MGKEFILERKIKMKRILSLLLVLVTLFSLYACGKSDNKEDMLANAIELNWRNVYDEYHANEARAKNTYDGKIVKWTAKI